MNFCSLPKFWCDLNHFRKQSARVLLNSFFLFLKVKNAIKKKKIVRTCQERISVVETCTQLIIAEMGSSIVITVMIIRSNSIVITLMIIRSNSIVNTVMIIRSILNGCS